MGQSNKQITGIGRRQNPRNNRVIFEENEERVKLPKTTRISAKETLALLMEIAKEPEKQLSAVS